MQDEIPARLVSADVVHGQADCGCSHSRSGWVKRDNDNDIPVEPLAWCGAPVINLEVLGVGPDQVNAAQHQLVRWLRRIVPDLEASSLAELVQRDFAIV